MNIREFLTDRVANAMADAGIPPDYSPNLAPSKKNGFGDYQANGAMAAAKRLKTKPQDVAQRIVDNLILDGIAAKVDVAGPGFINIHLSPDWLSQLLKSISATAQPKGMCKESPRTVVIDYSSPNLAKEMHVGHLRSTIIGDCLARVLSYLGDTVIRQNHVGDWGTQFGMLIAELESQLGTGAKPELALHDLEQFYQQAKQHFDDDADFADQARDYVVKLQSGDAQILALWQRFRTISLQHSEAIYKTLNVTLRPEDVCGESYYNDQLADIVEELLDKRLIIEDDGALVAFLQELADKNGNPSAMIIKKKDGGYLYATTDLAALRHRINNLHADRLMYFIDARQSLHMQQVFTLARKANFVDQWASLEHLAFGTMMGSDGKPFKTRTGGTVKLADLLEEAIERAAQVVKDKNPDIDDSEIQHIARHVGIGAIKYADLSKTRTNDYIFDWDAMLSFDGNTGPYLQYAYTRICSIFKKAGLNKDEFNAPVQLLESQERALALKNLQLIEVLEQVAQDAYPHQLCNYLYDLASLFMSFYEACPILKDGIEGEIKDSRLMLSRCTADTLRVGLGLLGIEVVERM